MKKCYVLLSALLMFLGFSGVASGGPSIGGGGGGGTVSGYTDVTAVFGSGTCSGYLKSDGTCDTPSGTLSGGAQYYLPYWTSSSTLDKLAATGSSGNPLISGGASAIPSWLAIVLAGGTNTFNISNGTAVLDIAAGATLNIDSSLAVTGGANTFNLANGTASLDIAAGATLNIDTSLAVDTAAVTLKGKSGGSTVTFPTAISLDGTMTNGYLCTYTSSGTLLSCNTAASSLTAGTATNAVNIGITDDTTTNATMYPAWVTTTTGNLPTKVSSSKMTFNPSTGTLTATKFAGALNGTVGATTPAAGVFTSVDLTTGTISATDGGTGMSTAASTGVPLVTGGNWSVEDTVTPTYGGTGLDTSASTGFPVVTSGTWSIATALTTANGGWGANISTYLGVPYFATSGTPSVLAKVNNSLIGWDEDGVLIAATAFKFDDGVSFYKIGDETTTFKWDSTGQTTGVAAVLKTPCGTNCTITTPAATATLYGTGSGSITSSQLATSLSNETGTGAAVFGTGPAITAAEVLYATDWLTAGGGHALTATEVSRTIINSYGQTDAATQLTLPTAAAGMTFIVVVGTQRNKKFDILKGASDLYFEVLGVPTLVAAFSETNEVVGSRASCATFKTGASAWSWLCGAVSGTWDITAL